MVQPRPPSSGAKNQLEAQTDNRAQQPSDVVARRTGQRVQRVAQRQLKPAAVHAVVGLRMPDHRLDGLSALPNTLALILNQNKQDKPPSDLFSGFRARSGQYL